MRGCSTPSDEGHGRSRERAAGSQCRAAALTARVLRLNDRGSHPRGSRAWQQLSRPNELGIAATVNALGEALYGHPKQALAEKHNELLKLIFAEVFYAYFTRRQRWC